MHRISIACEKLFVEIFYIKKSPIQSKKLPLLRTNFALALLIGALRLCKVSAGLANFRNKV